jgi:hypothetical protein
VLVDSNTVVQRDWFMRGAPWRITCFRAQQGDFRLVMPELVVLEATGRFRNEVISELEKLGGNQRSLGRLGIQVDSPEVDVDNWVTRYEATIQARVLGANGCIMQLPDIDLMHLVRKAVDRRRPFDGYGNGFRDALLWEHVLAQLDSAAAVSLISNDRRAFAATKDQPNVLAPDLVGELGQRGFDETSVRLYPDVAAYLRATGTVDLDSYAAVAAIIEQDREQLSTNLMIAVGRAGVRNFNGRVRLFIERAYPPPSIDLIEVSVRDASKLSLVTLQGDLDVDLYAEWENDDGIEVSGSLSKTVTYVANGTYDQDERHLTDLSVGTVEVDVSPSDLRDIRPNEWTAGDLFRGAHLFREGDELLI